MLSKVSYDLFNAFGYKPLDMTYPRTQWAPAFTTQSVDGGVKIEADIPGVSRDSLEVSLDQGQIILKGSRPGHGTFTKAFLLSENMDQDKITASVENGILSIHVPYLPKAQPRQIPITGG